MGMFINNSYCYADFALFCMMVAVIRTVSGDMYSVGSSRLHKELFSGYNSDVIPLVSHDSPVILKIFPAIVKLDTGFVSDTVMESTLSITMNWNDHRLRWDPETFDNISQIYTPLKLVWRPDISVHDMGQGQNEKLFDDHDLVIVTHTGSVTYASIAHVRFLCASHYAEFPFDESRCYLTIGSWLHSARHINMELWHTNESSLRLDLQTENLGSDLITRSTGQWSLVGEKAWGYMRNMTHACCPDDPTILFEITLQLGRNPGWMAAVLLLSVFVSALLLPLQFCISPTSDTRLLHGFVVLIIASISAAFLTSIFPTTQPQISKIGICVLGIISISTAALVSSIIVTVFSQRDKMGASPPDWILGITKLLQPLVCVKADAKHPTGQNQSSRIYRPPNGINGDFYRAEEIPLQESTGSPAAHPDQKNHTVPSSKSEDLDSLYTNMNSILEQLGTLLDSHEKEPQTRSDWHVIITVLDRMFLVAFTVLSIIFVIIAIS